MNNYLPLIWMPILIVASLLYFYQVRLKPIPKSDTKARKSVLSVMKLTVVSLLTMYAIQIGFLLYNA